MSTTLNEPELYERDFYLWTQRQAEELRRAAAAGANLPLDWQHLAEEIEDLGKNDRREVESRLARAIEHLLKLDFGPVEEPKRGWRRSVLNQRRDLRRLLRDSPSLCPQAERALEPCFREAVSDVERMIPDLELDLWPDLPRTCPYTLEQVLDPDWWPEGAGR